MPLRRLRVYTASRSTAFKILLWLRVCSLRNMIWGWRNSWSSSSLPVASAFNFLGLLLCPNCNLKFSNMPSRKIQVTQIKSPEFTTIFPYLNMLRPALLLFKKKIQFRILNTNQMLTTSLFPCITGSRGDEHHVLCGICWYIPRFFDVSGACCLHI